MAHRLDGMTTKEVAERLGITPTRVKQLRKSGRLVPTFETPLGYLYMKSVVDAYARSRTVSTTREIVAEAEAMMREDTQEGME